MGTVCFGNDHFIAITGYGDYVQGNLTICHVYYVEGLGHNLFLVGQFCDGDLEVAFRLNTCYVRNLEGDDLLTGSCDLNLYTIFIFEMTASSLVCLMSRATSTKSWYWHHRLSHLNFGTINQLTSKDLVDGFLKFKYNKDNLCSACEQGKSKKASFSPKFVPSTESKLELLHIDLCGPMRVTSINGKKYIMVIIDDYSRYTWTFYAQLCIVHKTSIARTPQQNEDKAPQIVSSSAEQVATEPNSLILNENADEFVQEDAADFDGNVFYNAPPTLVIEEAESSLTYQDPSNMHEFHQKHRSSDKCTKNHLTEQVIGDPSKPVMTRNRLQTDVKVCMYALIVSTIEPKNIKEAMLDTSWIESVQDELNQLKCLDVWELVECPIDKNIIVVKWIWKNKIDAKNIIIQNKSRLVAKGYGQEEDIDFEESFAPVARLAISSNNVTFYHHLSYAFHPLLYDYYKILKVNTRVNYEYAFSCEDLALIRRISFPGFDVLSIPCSPECKIVGQILLDHPLSYALTATADVPVVYLQQFWRTVNKVPDTEDTINIQVGYQGVVDKVSAFYMKNLAQPWQRMFKKKEAIQYPRFIKLIITDLMKKFPDIPQRVDEDYHSIKDDTPLVGVYTTGNVLVRWMLIPDTFLNEEICATDDFKESTPRAQRTPIVSTASPQGKKRKQTAGESKPGSHKENPKYVDDDDDEKKVDEEKDVDMASLETRTEDMQTPIPTPPRSHRINLSLDKNITQELIDTVPLPTATTSKTLHLKQRSSSKYSHLLVDRVLHEIVPQLAKKATDDLIENNLKPFIAATIIEDRDAFRSEMKRSLEDQANDLVLWGILNCKFERSSTSNTSCRDDDIHSQTHNDHQKDDAPLKEEERVKRHKASKSSKSARVDKPNTGLIYLNNKDEKWVMYLVEIVKFCNAMLEKVLKEVKLKIF
nr:integrase, catalytic region, zinc finger, CCHC-type, peptidase aspartic, catalytic [Tanacetum cinerariifolium]